MILTKKKLTMGLACVAVMAMGAGLSLSPNDTQAFLASADDGSTTTCSSDTLLMHDEVGYSADGITFKLTIPESYQEIIGNYTRDNSNPFNTVECETVLLITRAEKSDGYSLPTVRDEVCYGDYTYIENSRYVQTNTYERAANRQEYDYYAESYFFSDTQLCLPYASLMPDFDETNTAYFTIPHSEDNAKKYYYYAQVVEVWYSTSGFAFIYETRLGVSLTANIPCEGDMIYASEKDFAKKKLEDESIEFDQEERERLQNFIGVPTYGEQIETTIYYKTLANKNDPTSVVNKSQTIFLPAEYAQRKSEALEQFILKGQQDGTWGAGSSYFNAKYEGSYIEGDTIYETGNKIVRQVDVNNPYTYEYDYDTNTASITVNYADFTYNQVALKVTNNDPNDEQNLTVYVYTTDVVENGDVYTLSWNYAKVSAYMLNTAKWSCQFSDENIVFTESEYWTVSMDGSNVSVSFNAKDQNRLGTLTLSAVAEIVEDYECSVSVCYDKILGWDADSNTLLVEKVEKPLTVMYLDMLNSYLTFDNFKKQEVYSDIEGSCAINGVGIFAPVGVVGENLSETEWKISVQYEYPKFFVFENNLNGEVSFVPAESAALEFSLGDLVAPTTPAGYRVKDVAFEEEFIKVEKDAERPDDYKKTKITIKKVSDSQFYLATIEYTDKFNFVVEYFTNYVSVYGTETPFAVKTRAEKEVALTEYNGDPFNMTFEDVCRIVGKESMEDFVICGLVRPDEQMTLSFNGTDTYTITLNYGVASQRVINYEGQATEIQVPLRRYVDWLTDMGNDDWTILMLNNEKNKYFRFSNDVERDELYGFFSIAVFDEQYKDGLNNWISQVSAGGCMVMWEAEEAQGDEIYKWLKTNDASLLAKTCMLVCEVINDANHIYNYQFFYLDGSVDQAFISNGNADDAWDDDSALENLGQDILDGVWTFFTSGDQLFVVLRTVLYVLVGGAVVALAVWGIVKLNLAKPKKSKKQSKNKKK